MVDLINGGVYKRNITRHVLIFMGNKKDYPKLTPLWAMLHIDRHTVRGMSCTMFQHGGKGGYVFTEKQLEKHFDLKNWKMLDGRLRIEKMDDMSLVDFTIGHLEPIEKSVVYPELVKELEFKRSLDK